MQELIDYLRQQPAAIQALAVTVGGLAGVFITLFAFWGIIALSELVPSKESED